MKTRVLRLRSDCLLAAARRISRGIRYGTWHNLLRTFEVDRLVGIQLSNRVEPQQGE
jgi:hypothetical protein